MVANMRLLEKMVRNNCCLTMLLLVFMVQLIALANSEDCWGRHEVSGKSGSCHQSCARGKVCIQKSGCVCKRGYALDEERMECVSRRECPNEQFHHAPMAATYDYIYQRYPHSQNVLSRSLSITKKVVTFLPRNAVNGAIGGGNMILRLLNNGLDLIRYDIVIAGKTGGELVGLVVGRTNAMVKLNADVIDWFGRGIVNVQNQIRDQYNGILETLTPRVKEMPEQLNQFMRDNQIPERVHQQARLAAEAIRTQRERWEKSQMGTRWQNFAQHELGPSLVKLQQRVKQARDQYANGSSGATSMLQKRETRSDDDAANMLSEKLSMLKQAIRHHRGAPKIHL